MTDSAATLHQHIDTTADIVAAYVSRNSVPLADLPTLNRRFRRWSEPFLISRANKASVDELAEAGLGCAERLVTCR